MTVPAFLFPQGSRVRIRKGRFPLDPADQGREGMVVHLDDYRPGYYGIVLDGESALRVFCEDELEPSGD